jgi:hypothetical protein
MRNKMTTNTTTTTEVFVINEYTDEDFAFTTVAKAGKKIANILKNFDYEITAFNVIVATTTEDDYNEVMLTREEIANIVKG